MCNALVEAQSPLAAAVLELPECSIIIAFWMVKSRFGTVGLCLMISVTLFNKTK